MASPLLTQSPKCISCIRNFSQCFEASSRLSSNQQVRGKKTVAKISTVKVQLLQNISGYGREGAVVPVTPGKMRNIWYPRKMAEYATASKLQGLGLKKGAVIERDSTYSLKGQKKAQSQQIPPANIELDNGNVSTIARRETREVVTETTPGELPVIEYLDPAQSVVVLQRLLPKNIDLYRTSLAATQPTKRVSPSVPTTSTLSAAAASAVTAAKKAAPVEIYGSVSTTDIAANLKALLAEDAEGSRILLTPENISFLERSKDKDRVKHLGRYEFSIRLEGVEAVKRTVRVRPQA